MPTAAVLIVGDEILQGHTQDTNSHYLARRLAARGVDLRRIVTVTDEVDDIASSLEDLLNAGHDFVFVCGGIGPTPDDRTYEAVAMAVGAPLVVAPEDEAWMRRRIGQRGYGEGLLEDPAKAEALWRMIRRPEGSHVIDNPLGAALGSAVSTPTGRVIVLPGVPRELYAMMEQIVEPAYFETLSRTAELGELEFHGEEARTYTLLRELEARWPALRIGSYPQDDRGRILIRLQGPREDVEAALVRLEATLPRPTRRLRAPNKP